MADQKMVKVHVSPRKSSITAGGVSYPVNKGVAEIPENVVARSPALRGSVIKAKKKSDKKQTESANEKTDDSEVKDNSAKE